MLAAQFFSQRAPTSGSGSSTVTPSDTAHLVNPATGIAEIGLGFWVEVAGTVSLVCADGNTDTITAAANVFYPVPVARIKATGTAAGTIHVAW